MLQQVRDLREEGDELYELVGALGARDWRRVTPFKGWTVYDVIAHLHETDHLAVTSLTSPDELVRESKRVREARGKWGSDGAAMLQRWRDLFLEMCDLLTNAAPRRRLKWFGPDMGVRMFATARQMETWAHGQDIYDLLRIERAHSDRIQNIAVIGVRTFAWTFANRGLEIPAQPPYLKLTAPSGATWEWNDPAGDSRIEGLAVDFCRVVTQVRNVLDTELRVTGDTARRWMAIAQCFAGPPEDPPVPGHRSANAPPS